MTTTDIVVPLSMWDQDDKQGSIVVWLYADGARVNKGDVIAEILVEKVTFELEAPESGILHITTPAEVTLDKGDVVGTITQ
jgi:pyruvate/2-oxoglutarate dehydrogenase complex dihydrolipoamide acyltransferase (E2) component